MVGRSSAVQDLPIWRSHVVLAELFFGTEFIESVRAPFRPFARVRHAPFFQDPLKLAVFSEGPVNGQKSEVRIGRQLKCLVPNIDFDHFDA